MANSNEGANELRRHTLHFNEILYLSIKFVCKALSYVADSQTRELIFEWAGIILNILQQAKPQLHQGNLEQKYSAYKFDSEAFVYLRSRKWSIKFLNVFFTRMLLYKQNDEHQNNLTNSFYNNYWAGLLEILENTITLPTI
jgi:hypothetical protein